MTPGGTKETLDGIDFKWISKMSKELQEGKYKFRNTRRIYIPKKLGRKEKRPLGIFSPRDKVIQKALQLV
jgi:retron-type reverse transcriptase